MSQRAFKLKNQTGEQNKQPQKMETRARQFSPNEVKVIFCLLIL
jgi:hypothetical protein